MFFTSPCQFPLLFTHIAAHKEEGHKMFAVCLQNMFIKLETIMQTSSMAQFQDTEGSFSTLANSHNLLLFVRCDPTLVLELGFIQSSTSPTCSSCNIIVWLK